VTDFLPSLPSRGLRLIAGTALACALFLPCPRLHAAEPNQLNEKVSEELQKIKPLTDAKNWDGALALLNTLKSQAAPNSYDLAVISDIEFKIFLQKGDYGKAIAPLELSIRLADTYGFFEPSQVQEMVLYLAQIYYQEATATKSLALQNQNFSKASAYIQRWLKASEKQPMDASRQDSIMIYASILYNQAVLNPDKVDIALIKQSQRVLQDALLTSVRPKEQFYILLLATIQQEGDYVRSAELLEHLVKNYPTKKDYWQQLSGIYLNLSLDKDEQKAREYNIRAILAIERAQERGIMKTPKDNFNLVGIYFNVGQFGKATDILHSGLKNGSIESTQKNWELLAYSYQQVNQSFKAIDVLKEATHQFPHTGQLDYQIAQIYYSSDKSPEAYNYLKHAIAKGSLEKPGAVYSFLSYVCFELRKFEEALENVDHAIATPESKSDPQLPRLKQAIEDAIKEREATTASLKKS
jgi:predicted Zn-dependent protease